MHNEGVVDVTEFVHEFVTRELGSHVIECSDSIATTEGTGDVEVGDDATTELVDDLIRVIVER